MTSTFNHIDCTKDECLLGRGNRCIPRNWEPAKEEEFDSRSLTPTEDLIMEVLSARWRLGERMWTFDSRQKGAIDKLVTKGFVNPMHGMVQNTVRASLTDKGRKLYVTESYVPPVFKKVKSKHRKKLMNP